MDELRGEVVGDEFFMGGIESGAEREMMRKRERRLNMELRRRGREARRERSGGGREGGEERRWWREERDEDDDEVA